MPDSPPCGNCGTTAAVCCHLVGLQGLAGCCGACATSDTHQPMQPAAGRRGGVLAAFAELSPPYRTIAADPAWPIRWDARVGGRRRRATPLTYSLMSVDEIAALPVGDLATDQAHLYLWVTRDLFREGHGVRVARAWGFEPVAEIIWRKPNFGTGAFPRHGHEPLLICRRGNLPFTAPRDVHSVQDWPQVYECNGGKHHSRKPAAALDLVETASPGPYLELFSRAPRLGWDSWGWGYEINSETAQPDGEAPATGLA